MSCDICGKNNCIAAFHSVERQQARDDAINSDKSNLLSEIAALREQLKDCSAAFDRQQEMLDRNAEQIAALRFDAERYGRVKQFLQHGNGSTLDARGTDSATFDALIDALPKEERK
jgi:hypothetical protein